jgi:hypothetical protein
LESRSREIEVKGHLSIIEMIERHYWYLLCKIQGEQICNIQDGAIQEESILLRTLSEKSSEGMDGKIMKTKTCLLVERCLILSFSQDLLLRE